MSKTELVLKLTYFLIEEDEETLKHMLKAYETKKEGRIYIPVELKKMSEPSKEIIKHYKEYDIDLSNPDWKEKYCDLEAYRCKLCKEIVTYRPEEHQADCEVGLLAIIWSQEK